jgi:hypothetical protein
LKLAYLDPGTGSMIVQAVVGAVGGILVFLKLFGRRIANFFRGDKGTAVTTTDGFDDSAVAYPADSDARSTADQKVG